MADTKNETAAAGTEAPKRKRKGPTGQRKEKPTFAVVSYTDEQGQPLTLRKEGLQIRFTKDPFELVRIMQQGDGTEQIVEVTNAKAERANPAEGSAA